MKPYIICHMMASLDGRIDCAFDGLAKDDEPVCLKLSSVKQLDDGTVWLRYKV